jgi:hypothetical protein
MLIHETVTGVSEEIKWGFTVFATTKKIAFYRIVKKHITLGLNNIDKIQDHNHMLEGVVNTLNTLKSRIQAKSMVL